jgi:hypothetical protein
VLAAPKEEWMPKSWERGFGKGINSSHNEQAKKLLKLCMNIHLGGF